MIHHSCMQLLTSQEPPMPPPVAAPGDGGCEIEVRGINYTITTRAGKHPFKISSRDDVDDSCNAGAKNGIGGFSGSRRRVLKDVSCRAVPGEILAIVGPSGAGKSTLIEILAGRKIPSLPVPAMTINKMPADSAAFRRVSAYVTQRDFLFPLLTVRETLAFSARLRLGRAREGDIDDAIRELGLTRVADNRIAVLSGGERRRVSIGVEAIHDPAVLILDEPTSGLDSASAAQVVAILHAMAVNRRRTVVLSIHQPGARITAMFGSLLLLAGGIVLHHGTVEFLRSRLTGVGLPIPRFTDTIEFAIESVDALLPAEKQEMEEESDSADAGGLPIELGRCTLRMLFQQHKVADEDSVSQKPSALAVAGCGARYANSHAGEVAILAHRFFKNVVRTRQLFACRTITMLVAGVVLGSIFYHLGGDKLTERVGLFAFLLTFLMSSTTEALPIFLQEREILLRETSSAVYRLSSYVIANAIVFIPFLSVLAILFAVPLYWLVGLRPTIAAFAYFVLLIFLVLYTANSVVIFFAAAAPDFIIGNAAISGLMGAFFLFSGYFIERSSMPQCWVFMHYLSLFRWPFEAFLVNEFDGDRCVLTEFGTCMMTGSQLVQQHGLGEQCRWRNIGVMAGFIVLYRYLCFLMLKMRCCCVRKGGLRASLSSK